MTCDSKYQHFSSCSSLSFQSVFRCVNKKKKLYRIISLLLCPTVLYNGPSKKRRKKKLSKIYSDTASNKINCAVCDMLVFAVFAVYECMAKQRVVSIFVCIVQHKEPDNDRNKFCDLLIEFQHIQFESRENLDPE